MTKEANERRDNSSMNEEIGKGRLLISPVHFFSDYPLPKGDLPL
jgi:hypothetical protein